MTRPGCVPAIPNRARLLASVPPLVKMMRSGLHAGHVRADQTADALARIFQHLTCSPPVLMRTGRVAVAGQITLGHRLSDFRMNGGGRVVVEVDDHHVVVAVTASCGVLRSARSLAWPVDEGGRSGTADADRPRFGGLLAPADSPRDAVRSSGPPCRTARPPRSSSAPPPLANSSYLRASTRFRSRRNTCTSVCSAANANNSGVNK